VSAFIRAQLPGLADTSLEACRSTVRAVFRSSLGRVLVVIAAFGLIVAACALPLTEEQAGQNAQDPTTTTTHPPTTERTLPPPPTLPPLEPDAAEALAALPGRLLFQAGPYVGVANPDGSNATLLGGSREAAALQPTWSNEGLLVAWSSQSVTDGSAIVVYDPASGAEVASDLDGPPAFYLQWNQTDQMVSYLRNDPGGNGLEAGVVRPGADPEVFDTGAPYFFQWSPDRDIWVGHVGTERLSIVSEDEIVDIPTPLGGFSTPMWLDWDRVIFAGENGFSILELSTGEVTGLAVPEGPIPFVVDPTGTKVAYQEPQIDEDGQRPVPPLRVMDLLTGEIVTVTDQPSLAWEWSPDGARLAWVCLDRADAANLAQWYFWSLADEAEIGTTPPFRPSDLVLESYLPFFTQYAISHTAWAPDGSGFAFAGSIRGDSGIWVKALDADVEVARVGVGEAVFWSPDDAPISGSAVSVL